MTMLSITENPLLSQTDVAVRLESLQSPMTHRRKLRTARRQIRDLRSKQTAARAIKGLNRDVEIFGFTKGQFSLLDLLAAAFEIAGPAHLDISTWTASKHEITTLAELAMLGTVTGTRWLVDFSMARRDPEATSMIRQAFGQDAVRVAPNHSKFAVLVNETWKLAIRTSMNLNVNPRFENFQLAHDPEMADFLTGIMDEIFNKQSSALADGRPYEIIKHFEADL